MNEGEGREGTRERGRAGEGGEEKRGRSKGEGGVGGKGWRKGRTMWGERRGGMEEGEDGGRGRERRERGMERGEGEGWREGDHCYCSHIFPTQINSETTSCVHIH